MLKFCLLLLLGLALLSSSTFASSPDSPPAPPPENACCLRTPQGGKTCYFTGDGSGALVCDKTALSRLVEGDDLNQWTGDHDHNHEAEIEAQKLARRERIKGGWAKVKEGWSEMWTAVCEAFSQSQSSSKWDWEYDYHCQGNFTTWKDITDGWSKIVGRVKRAVGLGDEAKEADDGGQANSQ